MKACKCGSYAINHHCHGRDGSDDALCDVCYWRKRAEQPAQLPFGVGGGLVAIKTLLSRDPCVHANTAIQMIDAILAEQPAQQEPVGYVAENGVVDWNFCAPPMLTELYTSPPAQRPWVGLTDEEIERIFNNWPTYHLDHEEFARAIEAKLKEKNT